MVHGSLVQNVTNRKDKFFKNYNSEIQDLPKLVATYVAFTLI